MDAIEHQLLLSDAARYGYRFVDPKASNSTKVVQRMVESDDDQFRENTATLTKKLENKRESSFQDALSELFTEKQKELLFKVLNKETLTKTEKEYFSRVVKKRLKALRNPDLQLAATTLLD